MKGYLIVMIESKKTPLKEVLAYLPSYAAEFAKIPGHRCARIQEIRLRLGKFAVLELGGERLYLNIKPHKDELSELMRNFCNYSVYSFEKQISEGYITLKGGHRAGFAGTAIIDPTSGRVENIRDITSINIRIAKEYIGAADELRDKLFDGGYEKIKGLLIIGRPMSAKTTVLRDLIRQIGSRHKVTAIDERGELAAKSGGFINFDLGANTDVLDAFPKEQGFITAIRALSPDFIACDEIGADDITPCVNSGVRLIMTAHAASFDEALKSAPLKRIIDSGAVSHVAVLGTGDDIGKLKEFKDLKKERFGNYENLNCVSDSGSRSISGFIPSLQA